MNNLAGERLSIKSESGFQAAKAKYIPSQLPLLLYVLNAFQIILSVQILFALSPFAALKEVLGVTGKHTQSSV